MSLVEKCCDSLVDQIGAVPDQLQILIGEAAYKKLQKIERKKAKKKMAKEIARELKIILPDLIEEEIQRQRSPILGC